MMNQGGLILDANLFRDKNIPLHVLFKNLASGKIEPGSRFKLILYNSKRNTADPLEEVIPSYCDLDVLLKEVKIASPERIKTIGLLVYYWLLYHKPKYIRDTMFHEMQKVETVNVSKSWKELLLKWVELHRLIYERSMPYLDESMGTEENPIFKLHSDFLQVLEMISGIIS